MHAGQDLPAFCFARMAACIGYALLYFSCQLTVWGGLQLVERTGMELPALFVWWTVPLLAVMGGGLAVIGVIFVSFGGVSGWRLDFFGGKLARVAVLIAGALVILGYGFIAAGSHGLNFMVCVGAIFLGLGVSVISSFWVAVLSWFDRRDVVPLVLLSLVICAVLSLVCGLLPLVALEAIFVLATLGSILFLLFIMLKGSSYCRRDGKSEELLQMPDSKIEHTDSRATTNVRFSARALGKSIWDTLKVIHNPLLCSSSVAFAVAITRTMMLNAHPECATDISVTGMACMATGAIILLIMLGRRRKEKSSRLTISLLFRILFPLVATLLLAFSIGGDHLGLPVGATVFALYMIMSALIVPTGIEAAQCQDLHAVAVSGLFAGVVYIVFAGSTFLGVCLFLAGDGLGASTSLVAVLLVLYVLAMAFALVQRRTSGEEALLMAESGLDESSIVPEANDVVIGVADPIEQRCLILAVRYELSPRETDVLIAFGHGRNVSYLADQLCLSPNTIRSHSKTLYTKLGVHSKQEVIDLIDAINLDVNL